MTIMLTSTEMDKAVDLWLEDQGFSLDGYDKKTKVIAGRSDGPLGTRLEVTLNPIFRPKGGINPSIAQIPLGHLASIMDTPVVPTTSFSQRASQGHADEQNMGYSPSVLTGTL